MTKGQIAKAKTVECPLCKAKVGEACLMGWGPYYNAHFGPQHVGQPHRERHMAAGNLK